MSGTIGSLSISPSNPNILPPTTASVQLSGTGPNKDRQEGSHPHQVVYHEEYEELLVPDLGADAVYRLKRSPKDASWKLVGHIGFEAGGGPRHVVVYGMFVSFNSTHPLCPSKSHSNIFEPLSH